MLIILGVVNIPQLKINTTGNQNYPEFFIKVRVWGFVKAPGIYYLPPSSNILDAISAAGGPRSGANLSNVKLIRATGEKITYININKYIKGEKVGIPYLQVGDMIYIQESFFDKFINAVRFFAILTGSVGVIYQVIYTRTKG